MAQSVGVFEEIIRWWEDRNGPHTFFLQGEKNSGKTVFCQQHLQKLNDLQINAVYLDLRNVTGLHRHVPTRPEWIHECLARGYETDFGYRSFLEMIEKSPRTLVVVDGIESVVEQLTDRDAQVFLADALRFPADKVRVLMVVRPKTYEIAPTQPGVSLLPWNDPENFGGAKPIMPGEDINSSSDAAI